MSASRTGRRRPVYSFPPAHPSPDAVIGQAPVIRAWLTRAGLNADDAADVLQEIIIAALQAIARDRYRPDPRAPPGEILRRWLLGITGRKLGHFRGRGHRRREVSSLAPPEYQEADPPSLEARAEAWEVLRALATLRPELRDVIGLEAQGWTVREIAMHLAIPYGTAASRLRAARKRIAWIVKREGGQ